MDLISSSRRQFLASLGSVGLLSMRPGLVWGQEATPSVDTIIDRAIQFLRPRQDAKGGWSTQREPGITAMVVAALLRSGRVAPGDKEITRALAFLEGFIGPKGGLSEAPHANYTTAVALIAFHRANVNGRYDRVIKEGQEYMKTNQWDESKGKNREDVFYGGAGYGGDNSRPDLSNTSFFMEALRDTGVPANDPSLQKALIFVSRCQNLKSEFNDQEWAGKINDGGFIYTSARGGSSSAGKNASGGLRSYASMTYAGLKSMIYAGLTADDPRVKAALSFIKQHYSLDENPGLGTSGLYYYYHTFAKTMMVLDAPTLTDSSGVAHNWRNELTAALAKRQQAEGGWSNSSDRFMEGDPNLVTAYALLALAYAREKPKA